MKILPLNNGMETVVDDDVFEWASKYKWFVTSKGYVRRNHTCTDGKRRTLMLHRVVMNASKGVQVDHKDGDKLKNTRSNLRVSTPAENSRNRGTPNGNTSGYKGVCPYRNIFKAYIQLGDKQAHLGYFKEAKDAARVYNFWATDLFGEFARLNEIDGSRYAVVQKGDE